MVPLESGGVPPEPLIRSLTHQMARATTMIAPAIAAIGMCIG
jgi:hypothetical protein